MNEIGFVVVGVVLVTLIWRAPLFIRVSKDKLEMASRAADAFFEEANKLLKDERTPVEVLNFLSRVSAELDKPGMVRFIFWRALSGQLKEHAHRPTDKMRQFLKELSSMPHELRVSFQNAVAFGLVTNALNGGIVGELFLRFMLPDPKSQSETAKTFAAEMVSACNASECLVAA